MEPNQLEQMKKIVAEAKTKKSLEDIVQEINAKKDSDDNDNGGVGGSSSSGLSVRLVLINAPAAITYFSQKEDEEGKEIFSRLSNLFAQFSANPVAESIKEIQLLITRATEIKKKETGKGLEDLVDKAEMANIMTIFATNGSLTDAVERLKKMNLIKSKDLKL